MATHSTATDGHPISLFIALCIFFTEFLGAVLAITSDGFIRWSSFGMVGCGLFINYVVNRDKFNIGMNKWAKEILFSIKSFFGR